VLHRQMQHFILKS